MIVADAEFNLIGGWDFDVEESVTIVPNSLFWRRL